MSDPPSTAILRYIYHKAITPHKQISAYFPPAPPPHPGPRSLLAANSSISRTGNVTIACSEKVQYTPGTDSNNREEKNNELIRTETNSGSMSLYEVSR
ncbi:MAG TPA: hypothetical protein VER35_03095 [Candidatus Limnocylindrales bacterium]|nr:hypothetical protein [Candidatus Limnocylindrales bacterium]